MPKTITIVSEKYKEWGEAAFDLYCQGHSYEKIAKLVPVSAKTLRNWGFTYGWEEERKRLTESPLKLDLNLRKAMAQFQEDLVSPNQDIVNTAVDRLYKIAYIRQKMGMNQIDRAPLAVEITGELVKFAQKRLPELLPPEIRQKGVKAFGFLLAEFHEHMHKNARGVVG